MDRDAAEHLSDTQTELIVNIEQKGFRFSKSGISDPVAYYLAYRDFVEYCATRASNGTFTTYTDGEPLFLSCGIEFRLRDYQAMRKEGRA